METYVPATGNACSDSVEMKDVVWGSLRVTFVQTLCNVRLDWLV